MRPEPVDSAGSEPLLSSQNNDVDDDFDHTSGTALKSRKNEVLIDLLRSKYVVGCALFSSIGGLIFGYGIAFVCLLTIRSRNCVGYFNHAIFQITLPFDSVDERNAHILSRVRRVLRQFDMLTSRR